MPTRLLLSGLFLAAAGAGVGGVVWWAGQPDPARARALALARAGDFAAAEPLLAAAAAARPDDPEVVEALGRGYVAAGDPRAEAVLGRWAKAEPRNAEPHRLLMEYFWAKGDPAAFEESRAISRLECRDPEARRRVIECALAFDRPLDAETRCHDFLKKHPDDKRVRVALAEAQRRLGNRAAAAAVLDGLATDFPADPAVLVVRAALAADRNDHAAAAALYRQVYDADPGRRPEVGPKLAAALEKTGAATAAARVRAELAARP